MSTKVPVAVVCLAALAGLVFASVSTLDFVAHLDRQVHDLHCSFVPGLEAAKAEGAEGCKATLMSPYSSVFRRSSWGGIPISLPAMAVFAFILFRGVEFFARPAAQHKSAAGVLLGAALVPTLASAVMGWIAYSELHAACKLCIGIYSSSGVLLLGAVWAWAAARSEASTLAHASDGQATAPSSGAMLGIAALQALIFVGLPMLAYRAAAPDFSEYIGSCGQFEAIEDPYGVLVPLDSNTSGVPTVEVLDPMCPACRAFEERLEASGLEPKLHRVALLFPLDSTCNWMISSSLHPGACAVSEAVLCAHRQGLSPNEVIDWAFQNQDELLAAEKKSPGTVAERVRKRFGSLGPCLGSAEVQADLNKSLRWAVGHELRVMTPQLYVGGTKLCDEDTDLGMEWALTEILSRQEAGTLSRVDIVRSATKPKAAAAKPRAKSPAKEAKPARKPATKKAAVPTPTKSPPATPAAEEPDEGGEQEKAADPAETPKADENSKLPSVEELPDPKPDEEEQP
jgi:uncharacterized membrane protein